MKEILEILLQRWGKEIVKIESVNDQVLHAQNYIYRGIFAHFPQTCGNGSKPS